MKSTASGADRDLGLLVEPPADQRPRPGVVGERGGDRRRVGQHGARLAGGQPARDLEVGRRAVEQDHARPRAGPTAASASATFASAPGLAPAERAGCGAGGERAAVHALDEALGREPRRSRRTVSSETPSSSTSRAATTFPSRSSGQDRLAPLGGQELGRCTFLHEHAVTAGVAASRLAYHAAPRLPGSSPYRAGASLKRRIAHSSSRCSRSPPTPRPRSGRPRHRAAPGGGPGSAVTRSPPSPRRPDGFDWGDPASAVGAAFVIALALGRDRAAPPADPPLPLARDGRRPGELLRWRSGVISTTFHASRRRFIARTAQAVGSTSTSAARAPRSAGRRGGCGATTRRTRAARARTRSSSGRRRRTGACRRSGRPS